MIYLAILLALILVLAILPGTFELFMLTVGALLPRRKKEFKTTNGLKLVVVIPAHNEEEHLQKTLDSLKQNEESFTIVVVADNCHDKTVEIAQNNHIRVIERVDENDLGKHYALNYAFSILLKEDFQIFLIVDADCICAPNLIQQVQQTIAEGADGVQVCYWLNDDHTDYKNRILRVAFNAVNYLRPLGRNNWGFSAGILGTGFALKRNIIEKIKIPIDSVVEDACWHLEIVNSGYFIGFNPNSHVTSEIPQSVKAISKQRSRWEGGRLKLLLDELPTVFQQLCQGRFRMFEPCLDLTLLPLSYHAILLFLLLVFPFGWTKILATIGLIILLFHVLTSLIITKASWRDWAALILSPFYLIAKLLFVVKLIKYLKSKPLWEKTSRGSGSETIVSKNHKESL